ncbi:hypothetical protein OXPF_38800 [Oxobacter pfennigii]|uniref:DUF169 domain-containing protein n=1 Tax=Oxobacter pfennigii TaxID=36849 RepID=A0A0P8W216_9CLOT|nr:DUF169 domain-containing protein [Oxobacter pfennigii]KPU42580.1 hypothetical protein OXPF_38800 [Oxobacter pfennigii]
MSLSKELNLRYNPISVILADDKPEGAHDYNPAEMGGACVINALKLVSDGKSICFNEAAKGCPGRMSGMGFSSEIGIPGGFEYFLSCGRGQGYPPGEKLKKTPEIAKEFHDGLPKDKVSSEYIVLKPAEANDDAKLVIFLANPDQLSALVTLFSYESGATDNCIVPMSSGCASLFKLPFAELNKDNPRGVVGLVDVTVRSVLDKDILTFTVPFDAYLKMEENSKDCFMQTHTWNKISTRL